MAEKEMFGGLAFLLNGRMFCGVVKDELMVRVGPERYEEALSKACVRPMDFTGRPMRGMVFVAPVACQTDLSVEDWVNRGIDFVSALGAKKPTRSKSQKRPTRTEWPE